MRFRIVPKSMTFYMTLNGLPSRVTVVPSLHLLLSS